MIKRPGFHGQPSITNVGGDYWVVSNRLVYIDLSGFEYELPEGAPTDGASSRLFNGHLNLLPSHAQNSPPSWLHDWHYRKGHVYRDNISFRPITRIDADRLFQEGLILSGVGRWTAWKAYMGVRTFGFIPWNSYRKHEA